MRIEHLRYLVEVVDCGSMSKAAKNLFVTQPAISNAISALETEIGWPILDRTISGVQPTTKGKLVVDDARFIVRRVQSWNDVVDPVNLEKITGDVYIADSSELGLSFFQDTIMELNRMYPKLVVHSVPLESNPLKELNNGRFEMTVLPIVPGHHRSIESYLAHYNWRLDTLYVAECMLLLPPNSLLAAEETITAEMLTGYEMAVPLDFPYRRLLESKIPGLHITCEEPLRLVTSVASNDTVAIFLPSQDVLLNEFMEDGIILQREFTDFPLPIEINLIYPDYFARTEAGELLIQTIKERHLQAQNQGSTIQKKVEQPTKAGDPPSLSIVSREPLT